MPRGILRVRPGTEAKTRMPLRRGMSVFQAVSLVLRGLLKVALVDTRPHARCACVGNAGSHFLSPLAASLTVGEDACRAALLCLYPSLNTPDPRCDEDRQASAQSLCWASG